MDKKKGTTKKIDSDFEHLQVLDRWDRSFISQNDQSPRDLLNINKVNDGTVYKIRGCPS